jgi:hypothetical protein
VKQRCEDLGHVLDRLELDRVYRAMVVLADAQKTIADTDLEQIVHSVRAAARAGVIDAGADVAEEPAGARCRARVKAAVVVR